MNGQTGPTDLPVTTNLAANCNITANKISDLLMVVKATTERYLPASANGRSRFVLQYGVIPGTMLAGSLRAHGMEGADLNDDESDEDEQSRERQRRFTFHCRRYVCLCRRTFSTDLSSSVMKFLTEQYHLDPNAFSYDESYDIKHDVSIMSHVYINLGDYLARKYTNDSFICPQII